MRDRDRSEWIFFSHPGWHCLTLRSQKDVPLLGRFGQAVPNAGTPFQRILFKVSFRARHCLSEAAKQWHVCGYSSAEMKNARCSSFVNLTPPRNSQTMPPRRPTIRSPIRKTKRRRMPPTARLVTSLAAPDTNSACCDSPVALSHFGTRRQTEAGPPGSPELSGGCRVVGAVGGENRWK